MNTNKYAAPEHSIHLNDCNYSHDFGTLFDGKVSFNWNECVYSHILNEFALRMESNMSARH